MSNDELASAVNRLLDVFHDAAGDGVYASYDDAEWLKSAAEILLQLIADRPL